MPPKPRFNKKKKYGPKRRYKKKSFFPKSKKLASVRMKGPSPIPDKLFCKMKYHDTFVTTAGAVPAIHVYRNSLFDPDETHAGHQPMGRDEYAQLYNRYRVHGIGYTCIAINESISQQQDVVVIPKPNATALTDYRQFWELAYAKPRVVCPEGSGKNITVFKGYVPCARILGVTDEQFRTNPNYSALMAADPGTAVRLHIYSMPSDIATVSTVRWKITLVFYCELYDRHTLQVS